MSIRRLLIIAAALCWLAMLGCNGDYNQTTPVYQNDLPFTATYTYPTPNMREFPVTGSMIIHFNKDLHPDTGPDIVSLKRIEANDSLTDIPVNVAIAGGNLIITPSQSLLPMYRYELTISYDLRSIDNEKPAYSKDGLFLSFETLGEMPLDGVPMRVSSVMPDPDNDPCFDFNTFRVYFTEPVNRQSVVNGKTFILTDEAGNSVDGTIFARATQVVFDPFEDLKAGDYTLTLTRGILDAGDEPLAEETSYTFHVKSSQPRKSLLMENCPTLGTESSCEAVAMPENLPRSMLTGEYANSMLVDSLLLGPTRTYISGQLKTELGDPGASPSQIPLIIRKGQVLHATNIVSKLGGEIPTGLETGEITIHVLADSIGFLQASDVDTPVTGGPASVSLTLDAAITTTADDANMLMSQIILGTRLQGIAYVDPTTDHLELEIAGFAEFFIFGERIRTMMSLTMSDAITDLQAEPDTAPPVLRMTGPTPNETRVRLGNAIYLLFDEPVTPASATQAISLRAPNGGIVPMRYVFANGAKILLVPWEPLEPDSTYTIWVDPGLADINGNETITPLARTFTTGAIEWGEEPPVIGTTSPGAGRDLAYFAGQMPIEVWFSQVMDRDSIVLGDSFDVLDLSAERSVPGTMLVFFNRIAFYPNEPLIAGHTYRIVMTDDITNYAGVKLDLDRDHQPGGPDGFHERWIEFIALERNRWVPLRLMLSPVVDVNGSGTIDNTETIPDQDTNVFHIKNPLIPDPSYAVGYMIAYVKGLAYNESGQPYIDIEMGQGISMISTSTQVDLSVIFGLLGMGDLLEAKDGLFSPMGRIIIDLIEPGLAPSTESVHHTTALDVSMLAYFGVDNSYINNLLEHEVSLKASGDLTFSQEGLMVVDITGKMTLHLNLVIPLINITIPLPLPTTVNLRAVSRNPLSWWNTF